MGEPNGGRHQLVESELIPNSLKIVLSAKVKRELAPSRSGFGPRRGRHTEILDSILAAADRPPAAVMRLTTNGLRERKRERRRRTPLIDQNGSNQLGEAPGAGYNYNPVTSPQVCTVRTVFGFSVTVNKEQDVVPVTGYKKKGRMPTTHYPLPATHCPLPKTQYPTASQGTAPYHSLYGYSETLLTVSVSKIHRSDRIVKIEIDLTYTQRRDRAEPVTLRRLLIKTHLPQSIFQLLSTQLQEVVNLRKADNRKHNRILRGTAMASDPCYMVSTSPTGRPLPEILPQQALGALRILAVRGGGWEGGVWPTIRLDFLI
ncbi:unnamed protein product [Nezara viridula]|uniref:Uncharacterized protein n=1 Tax=Nezara viridula TaxID=85310 RepID=A0A9P0HLV3_NEZVI|nr:unnamed protein product [Nezara viridula]